MIIHNFVDELGVVDESKDYAPPNNLLVGDTQFGPSATIVVTDVEAQQTILDYIRNKNQGNNLEKTPKKGKRVTKPSKRLALPTISNPITPCKTPKAPSQTMQNRTTNVKIFNAPCKKN
jgi:hypothetical protein